MESSPGKPLIVVNFKDYPEATGGNAVGLAKVHDKVATETGANILISVHPTDLRAVCSAVSGDRVSDSAVLGLANSSGGDDLRKGLPVLSESGDSYTRGPDGKPKGTQTGRMTPEVVFGTGAKGILINHAENPRTDAEIVAIIQDFRGAIERMGSTGDFTIIVCAESVDRAEGIVSACGSDQPDYIAIEPPEMIGGDVSVTTRPDIISSAVERVGGNVLVGAGVKTAEDLKTAVKLGAKGVLLASGVVKPKGGKTPEDALRELALASLS